MSIEGWKKTTWWVDVQENPFQGEPIRTLHLDVTVEWGAEFGARCVVPEGVRLEGWEDLAHTFTSMVYWVAAREVEAMRNIILKSLAEGDVGIDEAN